MKRKKVGLFDPYLDVLGGGEKHILSILKIFEENGFDANIFWDDNLQDDFKVKLDVDFKYLVTFQKNIFKKNVSFFKKLRILKDFDYFFYVTDGSYFLSSAKKNYVFCMVPKRDLYQINFFNKLKLGNYKFIANSKFTQSWLSIWGVQSKVLYPYVDNKFFSAEPFAKEKIILSVGRFFSHLHTKKHDSIVQLFRKLKRTTSLFKDFRLILAGGLKDQDKDYFEKLKKIVGGDRSIILKPNTPFGELLELYRKSLIFWHFTGFGLSEKKNPELVEHLGITPLEAMASSCITFCYKAGGPKEFIRDGVNGFLFEEEKELIGKTKKAFKEKSLQEEIQKKAKQTISENFSYDVFKKRVEEVLL